MSRTALVWLGLTLPTAVLLVIVARWIGPDEASKWIAASAGVSLATMLASRAVVFVLGVGYLPFAQLMVETIIRLGIPIGVLFVLKLSEIEEISRSFLLYFLPFQFITLVAETWGSVWRLNRKPSVE